MNRIQYQDVATARGYSAIHEANFAIPKDTSVIGFDNFRNTVTMPPPLLNIPKPPGSYDTSGRMGRKPSRYVPPMKPIFEPVPGNGRASGS